MKEKLAILKKLKAEEGLLKSPMIETSEGYRIHPVYKKIHAVVKNKLRKGGD